MPLLAQWASHGVIDATVTDADAETAWSCIYRASPRPLLTCVGCGERMHAKVSPFPHRLRFFAHDAANTDCPWHGQSIEHYLLKSALAGAVRAAGWLAQLEASGNRWRADVLGISPDGESRIAWEAQLSGIATDEVCARTEAMNRDGVAVCWLSDWLRRPGWFGHVPSVQVRRKRDSRALRITDGLARFDPHWCSSHGGCRHASGWLPVGRTLPCPGHGTWDETVEPISLDRWVWLVCHRKVRPHTPHLPLMRAQRHGQLIWTAPSYCTAEQQQITATQARTEAERSLHELAAQRARQRQLTRYTPRQLAELDQNERRYALIRPTETFIAEQTGLYPEVPEWRGADPRYARGTPAFLDHRLIAVIMPDLAQLHRIRSRSVWFTVATTDDRDRLTAAGVPPQRVVLLDID